MPRDNNDLEFKIKLRKSFLKSISDAPVILEIYGGSGRIFNRVYSKYEHGVVLEKNPEKVEFLCKQRPSWAVYECDSVKALSDGFYVWKNFNFIDCDPYSNPYLSLEAFFHGRKMLPENLAIVVTDGMPLAIQLRGGGWRVKIPQELVQKFGNNLNNNYIEVVRYYWNQKAAELGYTVSRFEAKMGGTRKHMCYYGVALSRSGGEN